EHGFRFSAQIWKSTIARFICSAFRNHSLQRTLVTLSKIKWHELICRRHTLQRDCPHVIGMLSQVNERSACPVGCAKDIDLVVTERCSHVVQIVHRNRRGVEREISRTLEFLFALLHVLEREKIPKKALRICGIEEVTIERM